MPAEATNEKDNLLSRIMHLRAEIAFRRGTAATDADRLSRDDGELYGYTRVLDKSHKIPARSAIVGRVAHLERCYQLTA